MIQKQRLKLYCCCNAPLKESDSIKIEKRQLFDLPNVKIQVTEYQAHAAECKECHTFQKLLK